MHAAFIRLFPTQLTDRYFRALHYDSGAEVASVSELKSSGSNKILLDDSQAAEWLRGEFLRF